MNIYSEYTMGDMLLRYVTDDAGKPGVVIVPVSRREEVILEKDCAIAPLVEVKLAGDAYAGSFGCGQTMRDSETLKELRIAEQYIEDTPDGRQIITTLNCGRLELNHRFELKHGTQALRCDVTVKNRSDRSVKLELLASVSLGMLSAFANGRQNGRLDIYRMRSRWSSEAVLCRQNAEELLLTPNFEEMLTLRFGHIGNKPTNSFIPFAAVEDKESGVLWGMQLECGSSWQIEFSRKDNGLNLSGGLADADFGSWTKDLAPSEAFTSPEAIVSVCCGDIDDLCGRLVDAQRPDMKNLPKGEADMPLIFNEWCTTGGIPSEENMLALAKGLQGWPVRYLVMDAGWYKDAEHEWLQMTGDWEPSKQKYPNGLKETCRRIREAGFIPGIWFEVELCGELSYAYNHLDHMMLQRYGMPLKSAKRKFWDFRREDVRAYLRERVIGLLKECGIGYIKIDSNETPGAGCDGAESLGEGLRQQVEAVLDFFYELRQEIPDLVIENCSSGGQRLVGNFMRASTLASFSDATETPNVPIVAANLHRVILPQQSEVWCVLREQDDMRTLIYKLCSAFLGRIVLSGDLLALKDEREDVVRKALQLHDSVHTIIRDGFSRRYGPQVKNIFEPDGWQAVVRTSADGKQALVVAHSFTGGTGCVEIPVKGMQKIEWQFSREETHAELQDGILRIDFPADFEGAALLLT